MIDCYTRREFEARLFCIAILDSELTTAGESRDNASINFTNYVVRGIRDIYFSVKACRATPIGCRKEAVPAGPFVSPSAPFPAIVDTLPFLEIFRIMLLDESETIKSPDPSAVIPHGM